MSDIFGSLLGAAGNIVGGILGSNSAEKAKDAQIAQAEQNRKMQQDFAQKGIRWKVYDAQMAGIHPLAALGAQTLAYTPVPIGDFLDNSLGTGIAAAGQDIGRAIDATRTSGERADAFTKTAQELQLKRMGLENELLASQIAKTRAQVGPPMPAIGQNLLIS